MTESEEKNLTLGFIELTHMLPSTEEHKYDRIRTNRFNNRIDKVDGHAAVNFREKV